MFETFKSGNIKKQLIKLTKNLIKFQYKTYKIKELCDFIPHIQYEYSNADASNVYSIQLDNIQYIIYDNEFSSILDEIRIEVDNIEIYAWKFIDGYDTWLHKTPKAMLDKIKEHSKIFKQYNENIKEYLKNNSDYIIEQKKLNDIFSKSK